jgi:predicted small lipoprotein YifL
VLSRSWPVVVALALALAGGCGESSPLSLPEYEASVVSTRDRVDAALASITQAESRDDLLDRMEEAAVSIDRAAEDLDETGPAPGFDGETERLVDALRQLSTDLAGTAEQSRQPGFEDLLLGTRGLSFESWTKANRALQDLREMGVEVEPLARR